MCYIDRNCKNCIDKAPTPRSGKAQEIARSLAANAAAWLCMACILLSLSFDDVFAKAATAAFELKSSAFQETSEIPKKFTCDGSDVSPPLTWSEPPQGTRSFVLIMDDPDAPAGTWVHWVMYDIRPSLQRLPEAVPKEADIKDGGRQGLNDFSRIGYGGPCPPPGKPHRYFFRLYALDQELDLTGDATKADVERAIKGHIVGEAELMGRYHR
jgi:Raf kinase inhibitor-like YbhB/YbcL family protein